jgi:hypothetical protein
VTLRARWVTLGARWVTLRARWVTLRARWVTLRARWVTFRARWVTLRARWVTLRARWVAFLAAGGHQPVALRAVHEGPRRAPAEERVPHGAQAAGLDHAGGTGGRLHALPGAGAWLRETLVELPWCPPWVASSPQHEQSSIASLCRHTCGYRVYVRDDEGGVRGRLWAPCSRCRTSTRGCTGD